MFSLEKLIPNPKYANICVGILVFILLYNNLRTNYYGCLYESRIVNENTPDSYEQILLKIKQEDSKKDKKWFKIWWISYFGVGFNNYWSYLLTGLMIIVLAGYLLIHSIFFL